MDERDETTGRVIRFPVQAELGRKRQNDRTRRTLEQLADALKRPVSDFFATDAGTGRSPGSRNTDERD